MKRNNIFNTDIYSYFILKKKNNQKMMKKIFSLLRVDSTYMTTTHNRMGDVNEILNKYIYTYKLNKIVVCDFAISSGQSTYELYNDLNKQKIKNIYGFDKNIYIKIYRLKKFIFLFSSKNELLMVEFNKKCLRYRFFYLFNVYRLFTCTII